MAHGVRLDKCWIFEYDMETTVNMSLKSKLVATKRIFTIN